MTTETQTPRLTYAVGDYVRLSKKVAEDEGKFGLEKLFDVDLIIQRTDFDAEYKEMSYFLHKGGYHYDHDELVFVRHADEASLNILQGAWIEENIGDDPDDSDEDDDGPEEDDDDQGRTPESQD